MSLLLFLSDRCDLACGYCFLALNSGKPVVLSQKDAASAVDGLLKREGALARVTILGGEPLLHPELAMQIARRARAGGAKVTLVTNGTHAAPGLVSELCALGVEIGVSVDGPAETHDRHRRLAGGAPSHEKVLTALSRLEPASLRVNMVICEDTVGRFLSSVEWLRARGFTRLSFHADVARPWSEAGLAALSAALDGFARYARKLAEASSSALSLWHLDSYRTASAAAPTEEELVLGADGRYYASDAYLCRPYGLGLEGAAGDAVSGPDVQRLRELVARADAGVKEALRGQEVYTWPREIFLLAELQGRDAKAAVNAYRRADRLLGDALRGLAAEFDRAAEARR